MADKDNLISPNNSEDQTQASGDWDNRYIAPPDPEQGPDERIGQGHTDNRTNPTHEYGGSPADTRVSDSRSSGSRGSDSGSEAGYMGSAYDTERAQYDQAGSVGSGANSPTSYDVSGLNSSDNGATLSTQEGGSSVGGMLGATTDLGSPYTSSNSGASGGLATGGQIGDGTMSQGAVQQGTVGGGMAGGALGANTSGNAATGSQSLLNDSTGASPALGDPTRINQAEEGSDTVR